jgi:hypothetical protein
MANSFLKSVFFIFFITFLFDACINSGENLPVINNQATLSYDSLEANADSNFSIKYRIIHLNDSIKKQFPKQYNSEQLKIIGALNRIDVNRLGRLDSMIVPDTFLNELKLYAPFPKNLSLFDSVPLLILISYKFQAFATYENGVLNRWGPASLGKKSTLTPTGLFFTNWKSKRQISTDNPKWILYWNFNLVNRKGVSLHQYELPGYPASHSCVRLREEDAKWIYENAKQWKLNSNGTQILAYGTPVIIYGEFDFGKPRIWHSIDSMAFVTSQNPDTLASEIKTFLPLIIQRQTERKILFND